MPSTTSARNLQAFSDTVAWSEGTTRIATSDRGYNVLVGSTLKHPLLFASYETHPHIYNKALNSTAAGKHQLIYPTWYSLCARLNVSDFGPTTQEAMFESLVAIDCHAMESVCNGHFADAVALCSKLWTSLPGSNSGQPQSLFRQLAQIYASVGGGVA